jgi:putative transposase
MRYPASEKLEIIRLVEQSHQPVKKTLEQIGVSRPTFYRWYDLYRRFGEAGLEDRRSGSGRVWNRIPNEVRQQVLEMALDQPELSPRELAVTFTDETRYFVSEASVYRLLRELSGECEPVSTIRGRAGVRRREGRATREGRRRVSV